jgi:hypothetical protein
MNQTQFSFHFKSFFSFWYLLDGFISLKSPSQEKPIKFIVEIWWLIQHNRKFELDMTYLIFLGMITYKVVKYEIVLDHPFYGSLPCV